MINIFRLSSITQESLNSYTASIQNKISQQIDILSSHIKINKHHIITYLCKLNNMLTNYYISTHVLEFLYNIHPNQTVRNIAENKMVSLQETINQFYMISSIQQNLVNIKHNLHLYLKHPKKHLFFIDKLLYEFKHNGSTSKYKKQILELTNQIVTSQLKYSGTIRDNTPKIRVNSEIAKVLRTQNTTILLSTPTYKKLMVEVTDQSTRKQINSIYLSRCTEINGKLLPHILELRYQRSRLLGYTNHGDYTLEHLMAKNSNNVIRLLNQIAQKLKPSYQKILTQIKTLSPDKTIHEYDLQYYAEKYFQQTYHLDNQQISEYFPHDYVIKQLFGILSRMYDIKFSLVEAKEYDQIDEYFQLYKITQNNQLIGYFYLDLFPRKDKYNHAACFNLIPNSLNMKNMKYLVPGRFAGLEAQEPGRTAWLSAQVPVSAIVTNFNPPDTMINNRKIALLSYDNVNTLFHEFGHLIHQLFGKTEYVIFSGSNVDEDFAEVPSQIMENWLLDPIILTMISKHYVTNQPLSNYLITALIQKTKDNNIITHRRTLLLGLYDQIIHSININNNTQMYQLLMKIFHLLYCKIYDIPSQRDLLFPLTWGHIVEGYDSLYYSYIWSEIISDDLFSKFNGHLLDNSIGKQFMEKILKHGGSKSPNELIRDFLGRDFNIDNFIKNNT